MRRILFMTLCIAVLLGAVRSARATPVEGVTNPREASGGFVSDGAGVIGLEVAALIDAICRQLEARTGAELAVVTVDNLDGTTVEDYAVRLFKRFGVGKKGKDDGLLILFARDDRKVRIEVGYGLEGAINDAKAGRLLDAHAIPRFKQGEYGRGLYELTKAVAKEAAKASGATLAITDPENFPAQIAPPETIVIEAPVAPKPDIGGLLLLYAVAIAAFVLGGLILFSARVRLPRAKAAKKQALGMAVPLIGIIWFGAAIGSFAIMAIADTVPLPLGALFAAIAAATPLVFLVRRRLTRSVEAYRLPCSKCGAKMQLVGEKEDDRFLSTEEVAEEAAGGMDYEFWTCSCGARERLEVQMPKASACPQCRRRSLVTKTTVLSAATTSSTGSERIDRDCKNPNCRYHHDEIRTIPKVSSSSSGGSGSSSGGSSFGGGSSGGGGASRGW